MILRKIGRSSVSSGWDRGRGPRIALERRDVVHGREDHRDTTQAGPGVAGGTRLVYSHGGSPLVRPPIRFLRFNDTIIWSAPIEMFCEIATAVRDRSPFTHTFFFGYTNGWIGYLPTKEGFEEGGYEPKTSVFTGEAERDVRDGVITYLQSLRP